MMSSRFLGRCYWSNGKFLRDVDQSRVTFILIQLSLKYNEEIRTVLRLQLSSFRHQITMYDFILFMKYCLTHVTVANDGLTVRLLIIVLSWWRSSAKKQNQKESKLNETSIKWNIRRLLLLPHWVLLVHEGPSVWCDEGGGGGESGPGLYFPNSQNPPFCVWQSLFPLC